MCIHVLVMCVYVYIYIYIHMLHMYISPRADRCAAKMTCQVRTITANPRSKILDFRGFYSSRVLSVRGFLLAQIDALPRWNTKCGPLRPIPVPRFWISEGLTQAKWGGRNKTWPKIVPFSKKELTMKFHYANKVETPIHLSKKPRVCCLHVLRTPIILF